MTRKTTRPTGDGQLSKDIERLQSEWDRMDRAEPPNLLDHAVLNTARRELEPKNRRRPLRWLGGFATATVAVLAISGYGISKININDTLTCVVLSP